MDGPRAPKENEFPQIMQFLNQNLRPNSQWSIAHEYPTALSVNNIGNIRIITEGNKVLSHAVLKPLIIKTPAIIFKVAAIGSVVTDPEHRGQGLSQQILKECLNEADRQECDAAVLWTNLYDFYRQLNFELAAFEESVVLTRDFIAAPQGLKMMKGTHVAAESIHRLYNQHSIGSVRNIDEVRKFLAIPNTILYTAWDVNGQLAAYAVEGKGADLNGYIHEWGGSVSRLLSLFAWIRREKATPLTIILGLHSRNLIAALKAIPGSVHNQGYLGMLKLIRHDQLFNKIKRAARAIGVADLVLEQTDGKFRLGIASDIVEFSDEKEMVRSVFGPWPEIPQLKESTLKTLEKIFPVNLWIWGWDSI